MDSKKPWLKTFSDYLPKPAAPKKEEAKKEPVKEVVKSTSLKPGYITPNFKLSEFECKCGCKMPDSIKKNVIKLAQELQVIRDHIKVSMNPTSGYRCPPHNKKEKGTSKSQHLYGRAFDFKTSLPTSKVRAVIEDLISKKKISQGGIGRYNTFVHYDNRGVKARW